MKRRFLVMAARSGHVSFVRPGSRLHAQYIGWGWKPVISIRKPAGIEVADQAILWAVKKYKL